MFLHKNHIIYRDLKLDNILLASNGHIKLTDFGMCKDIKNSLANTFCGTPDYIAPEIIKEKDYGTSVDWWSFGVLLYQMLSGKPPFEADNEEELFESVLQDDVLYPAWMTKDAVAICDKFLTKNPNERLGGNLGPITDENKGQLMNTERKVQEQLFFNGIDWKRMESCSVKPPFRPSIKSIKDSSNFDDLFTRESIRLTQLRKNEFEMINQRDFINFSFRNECFET